MAKRKRLTPARPGYLQPERGLETKMMGAPMAPPIAQVAREAASTAALEELTTAVERARDAGLIVQELPLEAIDAQHLTRDRLQMDPDEMATLEASLTARGQQTPIEITPLTASDGPCTHGLISGWRRLTVLRALHARTGEARFATVKALVVQAERAQDAYVAMVEESEIRVNLSLYKRAHIALRAVQEGVFPTQRAALQGLYGSTTRSKRSKIGSFLPLVEALGRGLRHGPQIPEKLGLALARQMTQDPDFGTRLAYRLRVAQADSSEDELRVLTRALARAEAGLSLEEGDGASATLPEPVSESVSDSDTALPPADPAVKSARPIPAPRHDMTRYEVSAGLAAQHYSAEGRIELRGPQVDARLWADLKDWLDRRTR